MQLKTNRGMLKYLLLSLITFGIYGLVCMTNVGSDLNLVASRYDNRKTMNFCLMAFIVAPLTLGIGAIVWMHNISNRLGNEARRRGISTSFGAGSFWLWSVLGSLILIGPFVYLAKFFKTINAINADYNAKGM